jgi:hypothetical protein
VLGAEAVSVFPFCAYPGSQLFDELLARGAIRLDDRYFNDLVFTDYGRVVSYNERYSVGALRALLLGTNAVFYSLQFATHPRRLASLAWQLLGHRQESKVSNAIEPMLARQREYRRINAERRRPA